MYLPRWPRRKKSAGGGQVIQGRCVGEEGTLFFEVAKEPPGNAVGQLKRCIKDRAGQTWPIEFRIRSDAALPLPAAESTPQDSPASPPPAEVSPGKDDALTRFKERLKGLLPPVAKAVAAKDPASAEMKQVATQAQSRAKGGDWSQANALLDRLQRLLTPSAKGNAGDQAAFKARLQALAEDLKKTLASGTEAGKLAKTRLGEAQVSSWSGRRERHRHQ